MAFDFPNSPTLGQAYGNYLWDGEKWTLPNLVDPIAARKSVYAAPFDAMAYSGMQINGSMDVSQQWGSTQTIGAGNYTVDGWLLSKVGPQVMYFTQVTSAVPPGFSSSLFLQVNPADPSPAAGDYSVLSQKIEGYRIARLCWGTPSAQPLTIAFWVNAFRTGTYSGSVVGGSPSRSCAFQFTINASNTWEYKTVTIPGDTAGTWARDNSVGFQLNITLMAGSTFLTTPNVWTVGNFLGATGTINGVAAITDQMYITGVVVLPGTEAPSAARSPLIMRPYDQELVTCKRYFYNGIPSMKGVCSQPSGTGFSRLGCPHPVTMRSAPVITQTSAITVYDGQTLTTIATISGNYSTAAVLEFDGAVTTLNGVQGRALVVAVNAGGNLNVDARL